MTSTNDILRDNGRIDARKLNGGTPPDNPQGGGYIDADLCNQLRQARLECDTDGKVSDEFEIPVNTCRDHLRGRCHHNPETDPVDAQVGGQR